MTLRGSWPVSFAKERMACALAEGGGDLFAFMVFECSWSAERDRRGDGVSLEEVEWHHEFACEPSRRDGQCRDAGQAWQHASESQAQGVCRE